MKTKRQSAPLTRLTNFLQRQEDIAYQYLAEQIGDAFFLAGQRTGLFRFCNHRAVELTGYTQAELERLSLAEVITAQEAGETLDHIHRLDVGVYRNIQNVALKIKGEKFVYVDLRISATQAADGETVVILLAHDPADRLLIERAAAHHHRALTAFGDLGRLLAGQLAGTPPGATLQLLTACQQLSWADALAIYRRADDSPDYGLDEASYLPADFPSTLPGIDPAAGNSPLNWRSGERPISNLARAARNARFAVLHSRPIGREVTPHFILVLAYQTPPFHTLDTGSLADLAAEFFDASQQLRQQRIAAEDRAQHLMVLDQLFATWMAESGEGLVRVDDEGHIVELNSSAESLLGFKTIDSRGRPLEDVIVSAQPIAQPVLTAFRNGQSWGGVIVDMVRRDGTSVAAYLRAIPLPPGAGAGLILIADRTDQRQFQAQSDHLERRAWLGDLSAIFAHDVRNPLNGIATGLSYLSGKFEAQDPLYESVSKMQAEVNRIEQLLKNVLLVAKSSELNYQRVALHQLLERILARWESRLGRRNIALEHDIDPRTPLALADIYQMDQVFTNLLVNAVDAMTDTGGTLSVKCHAATHPRTPHGDFVQILFGDTGPGIPPEMQNRVFDPFVTTKSDGTGLGLAITKRIVTAHKGTIFVESWPGIGTAFFIFIPVARRATGPLTPPA